MLRTWPVRLLAIEVDVVGEVLPGAGDAGTCAWPPSLPSVPTSRATRRHLAGEGVELVDHGVDGVLSSRISPRTSTVIFLPRSPLATAVVTSAMLRTCR